MGEPGLHDGRPRISAERQDKDGDRPQDDEEHEGARRRALAEDDAARHAVVPGLQRAPLE
ncbi:MAG TPA: hypothetical protein VE975_01495 [Actinomycetota bacterium]|nr:hypothetical protein [Actinomycetota bacterium]